jgi:MFS family permease
MTDAGGGTLWRNFNFLRLWAGQSVSSVGSEVTAVALPLTAVLVLHASALELGILRAAWSAPQLLFSIIAGIGVDRFRRRPLLITSDLARAGVLMLVPTAVLLGALRTWLLIVVAFVVGSFNTLFAIAYQAFLPSVVRRSKLVEANSKLQTTLSIAQVGGPGLGGVLIQLLTAPVVLLVDSVSYLVSAALLARTRVEEHMPWRAGGERRGDADRGRLGDGWRLLYRDPLLRAIGGSSAILGLFFGVQQAVFILYMADVLHLDPTTIGLVLAVGSLGGIAGAIVSGPIGNRSLGPTLIIAVVVNGFGATLLAFASGPHPVPLLVAGQLLVGVSFPLYFVNQTSLRQSVAPPEYLGRITAAFAMVSWGMIPVGAIAGGVLPQFVSLQATLVIGGIGKFGAAAWLLWSPIRRIRRVPAAA